jgi:hypothetical protein
MSESSQAEKMARLRAAKAQKAAERAAADRPMSSGFGESIMFNAPEGEFDDPTEGWTVNGEPIPSNLKHAIPYENTDQGRAERQANIDAKGGPARSQLLRERIEIPGGLSERGEYIPHQTFEVAADPIGKKLLQQADDIKAGRPWEESADAMREIARPYIEKGMSVRFLSPAQIERGLGMRGYEFVKDENGNNVMCGNMPLGYMPRDTAEAKQAYYKNLARERMVSVQEQVQGQAEQISSLSKIERISGRGGDGRAMGFERSRGDAADMDDRDFAENIPGM